MLQYMFKSDWCRLRRLSDWWTSQTTAIFDVNLGQFKCEFDCPIRELSNGFLRIFSYSLLLFLFRDGLRRAIMEMSWIFTQPRGVVDGGLW